MNPLENVMKNAFNELRLGFGTSFIKQNFILKRQRTKILLKFRRRVYNNRDLSFILFICVIAILRINVRL